MQEREERYKIGITIGDINGVGMEVIMKTFTDTRLLQHITPIIYGSAKALSYHRKALNMNDFNYNTIRHVGESYTKKINLVNCWEEEIKIDIGKPTETSGKYAFKSLQAAIRDLKEKLIDAIVTAPINKKMMQSEEFRFPGHTEYFAKTFEVNDFSMMLVSGSMRVAFVTGHTPLRNVAGEITKEKIVKKLKVIQQSLKRDFGVRKPRIAILALNPHAGDDGQIGNEEKEIIAPLVKTMQDEKMMVYGPFSADGFFGSGNYASFDAVLAMYHDQGLIPFKTLAFDSGVNFTAGLPVVRTSPDHGTAYDIAGKGVASEKSFREAVYLACDIVSIRKESAEANANPLEFSKKGSDR